jgi:predicted site-specific integrase-resolvase
MKYKISTYAKLHKVTIRTVWNWIKLNKVNTERTTTGGWLIIENEIDKEKNVCIYARVSSSENKENLEQQKNRLISFANAKGYKISQVVTEIGSGLNDNRPKLEKILLDKSINLIIVEHKDRLARFGLNYIEKLLELDGRKIEYINPTENERDDLMEDFVSIITSFTARLYGQRRTKRKTEKLIKELESIND